MITTALGREVPDDARLLVHADAILVLMLTLHRSPFSLSRGPVTMDEMCAVTGLDTGGVDEVLGHLRDLQFVDGMRLTAVGAFTVEMAMARWKQ